MARAEFRKHGLSSRFFLRLRGDCDWRMKGYVNTEVLSRVFLKGMDQSLSRLTGMFVPGRPAPPYRRAFALNAWRSNKDR